MCSSDDDTSSTNDTKTYLGKETSYPDTRTEPSYREVEKSESRKAPIIKNSLKVLVEQDNIMIRSTNIIIDDGIKALQIGLLINNHASDTITAKVETLSINGTKIYSSSGAVVGSGEEGTRTISISKVVLD